MHIEVSGKFWNCDCLDPKLRCIPVEWPFCPNCSKKQPERLPEAGDWVWVKAQVKEVDQVFPETLTNVTGFRLFAYRQRTSLYVPADYGKTWMRVTANQAKLLTERANECDELRKTYAQVMTRNAEIVSDYQKFDAYLSRISDIIDERCDLSVMMMAIREVLKEWKEAP